jgi:uncharacterized protein (TIGR03437 family)
MKVSFFRPGIELPSLSFWRTAARTTAILAIASGIAAGQTSINQFLDDTVVQNLYLTVEPSDWSALLQNYTEDTYYPATFTWNSITLNIGIRQRGVGSRSAVKPNLDLNFGYYVSGQTFLGESKIVLKANNNDPSNMREWTSMKLFRRMGFPAPRESFGVLYVNGAVFGFYLLIEHADLNFVQRNLGESGGYLYNWKNQGDNYDFGNLGTNPLLYAPYLDLKSGQATPDLQTFENLVQVINRRPDSRFTDVDFIVALSKYLDPNSFLAYAAIDNVLAESDGLVGGQQGMNNFLLYQFQGTTLYQVLPWDKAYAFSTANRDILDGFTNGPLINMLAQRLAGISPYLTAYLEDLTNAATVMGSAGGWADSEVTREYNLINNAASNDDPYKQCVSAGNSYYTCGVQDFQSGVAWLHTFLAVREDFVLSEVSTYRYQAPADLPNISAVTVAGPGGIQALAPGSINYAAGTNLGPSAQASTISLPRNLSNAFVAVEGVRAPLLQTSSGQIEFQAPWDIPLGAAAVVASVSGVMSSPLISTMQSTAPAILTVTHAGGSAVDSASPANPGEELVIYMIGLGSVNATIADGATAPSHPLASTTCTLQISLANASMTVSFSGLSPGLVGIYQVNATAPSVLPQTGTASIQVTASGQTAAIQIAVN